MTQECKAINSNFVIPKCLSDEVSSSVYTARLRVKSQVRLLRSLKSPSLYTRSTLTQNA